MTKTYHDFKAEVAQKYRLGSKLVIGHRPTYYDEAAELYAEYRVKLALEESKKLKPQMKDQIEFSEFLEIQKRLEITIGLVTDAERVPKSDKLLKLTVDFGNSDVRIVVTNIGSHVRLLSELTGHKMLFVTNLKPTKIMGIESTAMIMPGEIERFQTVTVVGQIGNTIL